MECESVSMELSIRENRIRKFTEYKCIYLHCASELRYAMTSLTISEVNNLIPSEGNFVCNFLNIDFKSMLLTSID